MVMEEDKIKLFKKVVGVACTKKPVCKYKASLMNTCLFMNLGLSEITS